MAETEYPKTAVNKLGRLPKRGAYDYATVHGIINSAAILHVSFVDPEHPFPVVLPMLGCTAKFGHDGEGEEGVQDIYIHGYVNGRLFRQGKASSEGEGEGLAVTVAASHMDGLVLALAPFHNSCNYRSSVAYGYATLVTDEAEQLFAMERITNSLLPTRWQRSRQPPTPAELTSTSVLRVRIASASAKVRTGGPSEDRKDAKNEKLGGVWTGVLPCWVEWGEPVGAREGVEVEGWIEAWRGAENGRGRAGAGRAAEGK
ncbi:hypothetical protein BU23DRAFT_645231 [Bimuria novae-zelandiae CBS 107.79]|uniref:5-nitroimidazole antibiotic resistance protein n=1 Tax=Bimuria novae-zelandiae CBS 107.79 TaxID=1447943 RepID=A0A6A5V6S8_9PLEO|nr:hypothetical protein BU23DRAFT_645231 [Bimuria novae-zelandiae CBS 107.79]